MKINVEFDMSPEEARALMGLPNVTALQAEMLEEMRKRMKAGLEAYDPAALLRAFIPTGAQGFEQLQRAMWDAAAKAAGGSKPSTKSTR